MLFNVSQRTQKSLFFAAPKRHADRSSWLDANSLQDARSFHHNRATNRVVGRAGRGVPRIEMSPKHYHFVFLIRPGNLRDGVVRGLSFRVPAINDVELEFHRSAVGKNASDSSVIFVAHHHSRQRLSSIEGSIVESADLTMLTPRIVDSDQCAACDEELIELLIYLACCRLSRFGLFRLPARSAPELARVWIVRVVTFLCLFVVLSASRRI